jgi:hypothetical protein
MRERSTGAQVKSDSRLLEREKATFLCNGFRTKEIRKQITNGILDGW